MWLLSYERIKELHKDDHTNDGGRILAVKSLKEEETILDGEVDNEENLQKDILVTSSATTAKRKGTSSLNV